MDKLRILDYSEANLYVPDDPVRPGLGAEFRLSGSRQMWGLVNDNLMRACICTAVCNDVPHNMTELVVLDNPKGPIAIFYSVWSYSPGGGRDIVFAVLDYVKNFQQRYVTLSPRTNMAHRFHIKNGAKLIFDTPEVSRNYEYFVRTDN